MLDDRQPGAHRRGGRGQGVEAVHQDVSGGRQQVGLRKRYYPGTDGEPYNRNNFDVLGRAYFIEARWSFGKGK